MVGPRSRRITESALRDGSPSGPNRGFGAGEIAGRAGVSLAAFYDCFEDKEAWVFAGYDRFIEVLLTRMANIDASRRW